MKDYKIIDSCGKSRKAIKIKCLNCNKTAILRLYSNHTPRFCSSSCSSIYKSKKSRVELNCENCNMVIFKRKSSLINSKHKVYFCNRICKEKAQSLKGKCKIIRPNHYGKSNNFSFYKDLIKKTKNPKCSDCKESRRYILVVHHKDSDRKNNNINNLEIVCANCHMKRHLKFINNNWIYKSKALTPRNMLNKL